MRPHLNITNEEALLLDKLGETLRYPSRTALLTALVRAALYGSPMNAATKELVRFSETAARLETLRGIFFEILDEYAFPIIARLGADKAYFSLKEDLKTWMYDRCRTVPLYADMKAWTRLYYAIKKSDIIDYRIQLMTETYKEENGIGEETANEEKP